MKKFIFIALAVLALSSCGGDTFITEVVSIKPISIDETVTSRDWRRGDNDVHGVHFFAKRQAPELTWEIFRNGLMQAYLVIGRDQISPLPFSDFFVDNNGVKWEEHITVEFEPGFITFILKNDDQVFENPFFDEYKFLVRLFR